MTTPVRGLTAAGSLLLGGLIMPTGGAEPEIPVSLPAFPEALVTHCFQCHDGLSAEADLDLEMLEKGSLHPGVAAARLEDMLRAVRDDTMPPKEEASQPSEQERAEIINWLECNLQELAVRFEGDPGEVVMPRLTPWEYRNVIRDLSGGVLQTAGNLLPSEGGAGEGFGNVGEAQGMTATHLEKYLEAAREVLRHLRLTPADGMIWSESPSEPVDEPAQARFELVNGIIGWHVAQQQKWGEEHREALSKRFGFVHAAYLEAAWRYRHRHHGSIGLPEAPLVDFAELDNFQLGRIALEKWWRILNSEDAESPFANWAAAWRELPEPGEVSAKEIRQLCVSIEKDAEDSTTGDLVQGFEGNEVAEEPAGDARLLLTKRNIAEGMRTKVGLNAERNVLTEWLDARARYLGGPWLSQDEDQAEPEAPYHYTAEEIIGNATAADLAELDRLKERLESVTQPAHQDLVHLMRKSGWEAAKEGVLPPEEIIEGWSSETRNRFWRLRDRVESEEADLEAKARRILGNFTHRAWRRPVRYSEMDTLVELYRGSRRRGYSYDSSVKTPLMVVLASPDFLYRGKIEPVTAEENSSGGIVPLSGYELASRLSFFLWASIPDEELMALARQGKLEEPAMLRKQARRMLKDPRAASLATDFGSQLWGFGGFESFTGPDEDRFPEFDEELRQAMLDEVTCFLGDLIHRDSPLTALLDSRHTFVNDALAAHYGIPGVKGTQMRRVNLDASERGGLPGMAVFLTKTSLPLRTSPVQRGNWVMEKMLGRSLPSPPAMVTSLSEDEKNGDGENIRVQLERHREDASCASCHQIIDPLGIALENFDAIGRWRERERDGLSLVNQATTADGVELRGIEGLKEYLLGRQDEVFRHFNRKLLGYALGRAIGPGDYRLLEQMQVDLEENDHRLSVLVDRIVTSPQFLNRRHVEQPQTLSAAQP